MSITKAKTKAKWRLIQGISVAIWSYLTIMIHLAMVMDSDTPISDCVFAGFICLFMGAIFIGILAGINYELSAIDEKHKDA